MPSTPSVAAGSPRPRNVRAAATTNASSSARRTVPDAKRRYLQGKILMRLCQHDEARRFLETSLDDLVELALELFETALQARSFEACLEHLDTTRRRFVAG